MFRSLEYSSFCSLEGRASGVVGKKNNETSAHFYLVYKIKDQMVIEYKSL